MVRHDVYQSFCKQCHQLIKLAIICQGCSKAFFCSTKCHEADEGHTRSQECALWKEEPSYPHFSLIQLFQALWKLKTTKSFRGIFDALVSYEDASKDSWDEDSEAGLVHWIASIRAYAPKVLSPEFSSAAQIRKVYFAIKLNAFNVKPDEASRAHCSGLYSKLALFNHSCDPNCGIQYRTSDSGVSLIRLVALKPIKKGDELAISYRNPFVRADVRRSELKKNFFFDCACPVCSSRTEKVPSRLSSELISFCIDDENTAEYKVRAFRALLVEEDVDHASVTEAAVSILNSAMRLRGHNRLDNQTANEILDLFFDPKASNLKYIETASPDLYWQWIVFFTDASMRAGHPSTEKLARMGLDTIHALYPDSVPETLTPYITWFTSINRQQ